MRRLLLMLVLGVFLAFPYSASAQSDVTISSVRVQFWPEYDQPSMLVIVDFKTSAGTQLPADLTFRIPAEADLIAVASDAGGGQFLDSPYEKGAFEGEYQTFSMTIDKDIPYRFEYYQPLAYNGNERSFSYQWDNGYAVENFQYVFLEPLDVTSFTLDPVNSSTKSSNGLNSYGGNPVKLAAGEPYTLTLKYKKTTDTLVVPGQTVQIAEPVNEDTPGRISLTNSLPYILGGLGVFMIAVGLMYYFQWGRASGGKPRRRHTQASAAGEGAEVYCPQCGSRAKSSDRFCRTCGARLRHEDT